MLKKPHMLLGFDDYDIPAKSLAKTLNIEYTRAQIHRFPDGESKLTLPERVLENPPKSLVICRSLDQPNSKLIELLLAVQTAKALGVRELILVAPYLCYMRQDMAFHPGEAISQKIIGHFLSKK